MWEYLSRENDLVELVKSINSVKKLKSLKTFLSDGQNTMLLRDSHVYEALKEIPKQIYNIAKEDPARILSEIAEHLF